MRKMQLKTTVRYQYTWLKWKKKKKNTIVNNDVEELELSYTLDETIGC